MDLAHDNQFDAYLTEQEDLAIVTGQEAFQQEVIDKLTDFLTYSVIGSTDRDSMLRLIELQAQRVAEETTELESLPLIVAQFDDKRPNTVLLQLVYQTGDDVTYTISF